MLINAALLLLRLGTGLGLMSHGYPKLFGGPGKEAPEVVVKAFGKNFPAAVERGGPANFSQGLQRMNIPAPQVSAYLSGLAEFAGGAAIALGLATRPATLAVMFNMGVAIRKAHWQTGFSGQGGYELAYMYSVSAATLFLAGPGVVSLDRMFGGKKSPEAEE